jgi:hypothetical protein
VKPVATRTSAGDEAKPEPEPGSSTGPTSATVSASKSSATVSKPAARRPSRRPAPKRRGASRSRAAAKPGERERQLLALIAARPGITVPEAAAELGVDPTGLYGIVRRLQSRYQIIKDGSTLRPVDLPAEPASA